MNFSHVFGMVVVEGEVGVPFWDPSVLLQLTQGDSLGQTDLYVKKYTNYYNTLFELFCVTAITYFIFPVYKCLLPVTKHLTLQIIGSEGKVL